MSLLSYERLCQLIEIGVIDAEFDQVNSASIDLTLGSLIILEDEPRWGKVISLSNQESMRTKYVLLNTDGYIMKPGEFLLAHSREIFHLPNNISAEYKLNSSMARNGLENLNAGWCDAGWNGSVLTLEFKNMLLKHDILITPGMKCGQIVFFEHEPVPDHASYAVKGRYNGDKLVTSAKS